MKRLFFFVFISFIIISCDAMFNAVVTPNSCQRCEVFTSSTDQIIKVFEGCGGANTRLEQEAKAYAYDVMNSDERCDIFVHCVSWTKDDGEE